VSARDRAYEKFLRHHPQAGRRGDAGEFVLGKEVSGEKLRPTVDWIPLRVGEIGLLANILIADDDRAVQETIRLLPDGAARNVV
jgi:hypothetical protein